MTYDMMQITAEQIESALLASRLSLHPDFMSALREEWSHLANQKERECLG
ncbi:MAG: hypothetical protein H7837_13665 [Magnetococcus sp. MYC-9]